jgi:ankyrin repeat protein
MLMDGSVDTARLLLKYGADIAARNVHGSTALHWARTSDKVRFLVERGADINARTTPPEPDGIASTPLQSALNLGRVRREPLAATLLELGADPKIRDGAGRSTLCYCWTIEHFRRIQSYGLDPVEKLPDGGTLLHNLVRMTGVVRVTFPEEVAFLDFLLGLGLGINARDDRGQTALHLAAERAESTSPADYQLLLDRGADKSITDKAGQRAFDLVPKSKKEARALLA